MATIRLRFVAQHGPIASVIRAAQLGWPWSHVDAAVADGWLGAHAGSGVALRPLGYDAHTLAHERIYALELTDDAAERFRGFLVAELGKPYDFGAIAAFAGAVLVHPNRDASAGLEDRDWHDPSCWICSELQAAALIHAGVFPHGLADGARHVTPQNLAFALSAIAHIEDAP